MRVLGQPPGNRSLAECAVLDVWLRAVPLLSQLDEDRRLDICRHATAAEYERGQKLAEQGAKPQQLGILYSGHAALSVQRGPRGRQSCVGGLGARDSFGEVELLTGGSFESSVVAKQLTVVVHIPANVSSRVRLLISQTYVLVLSRRLLLLL